jgi:hypothetical protein
VIPRLRALSWISNFLTDQSVRARLSFLSV